MQHKMFLKQAMKYYFEEEQECEQSKEITHNKK